jgi:hypothetical protein
VSPFWAVQARLLPTSSVCSCSRLCRGKGMRRRKEERYSVKNSSNCYSRLGQGKAAKDCSVRGGPFWLGIQESQPHSFPPAQGTKHTALDLSFSLSLCYVYQRAPGLESHCCSFQELDHCTSPFFPCPPRCFPVSFPSVATIERRMLVVVSNYHFFRKRCLWKHSDSARICLWALFGTRIRETGTL